MNIDDKTPSGIHVEVIERPDTPPYSLEIRVDGQLAIITGYEHYRDGGTMRYQTDLGTLTLPHKLGSVDRVPKWNHEDIGPVPDEVIAERKRKYQAMLGIVRRESNWL